MGKLDNAEFLTGDVIQCLDKIPENSVHTCVTSPPYWRLRDYGEEGQIGMEDSPSQYIERLTNVFSKLWEVIHERGTVWLVMGDTYYGGGKSGYEKEDSKQATNKGSTIPVSKQVGNDGYLKPKDLCMIPQRLAISLQKEGWYLRNQIIWAKDNPMPESVKDRLTNSHEYIYLLSKNKDYFYDHEAIKEESSQNSHGGGKKNRNKYSFQSGREDSNKLGITNSKRNKRDVWNVNTSGYSDAHFAVFPLELIEPCIKAGTPSYGVCINCKTPYKKKNGDWIKNCDCGTNEKEAATVLDCFSGSGTTGIATLKHERKYIGIDINEEYHQMAKERIRDFNEVPVQHDFW